MNGLNSSDSEYKGLIENAFQHLENFKQTYTNSAIAHKKKLISSIFPEKIEFDGKKCRTTRINDVLRYILQIDKELDENKKGQISKNMSLSLVVESEGIGLFGDILSYIGKSFIHGDNITLFSYIYPI